MLDFSKNYEFFIGNFIMRFSLFQRIINYLLFLIFLERNPRKSSKDKQGFLNIKGTSISTES